MPVSRAEAPGCLGPADPRGGVNGSCTTKSLLFPPRAVSQGLFLTRGGPVPTVGTLSSGCLRPVRPPEWRNLLGITLGEEALQTREILCP